MMTESTAGQPYLIIRVGHSMFAPYIIQGLYFPFPSAVLITFG